MRTSIWDKTTAFPRGYFYNAGREVAFRPGDPVGGDLHASPQKIRLVHRGSTIALPRDQGTMFVSVDYRVNTYRSMPWI